MERSEEYQGVLQKSITNVIQSNRGLYMKTEVVHTRVDPNIKKECDEIFKTLGLTTSHAIMLFLNQTALEKGLPFSLSIPENTDDLLRFGEAVNSVEGASPSLKAKRILRLYAEGEIDNETAQFAIKRLYKK